MLSRQILTGVLASPDVPAALFLAGNDISSPVLNWLTRASVWNVPSTNKHPGYRVMELAAAGER
jgi:hypothetical protein